MARTGGVAGMTRRWSAQPPAAEAPAWRTLIDRCPWTEIALDSGRPPVPDGFVWLIRASWTGSDDAREAEVPDDELVGAWRELVDAVRDWSGRPTSTQRRGR